MNKYENIKMVYDAGDQLQFNYGLEFGYFANKITNNDLNEFCNIVNTDKLTTTLSYKLCLGKLVNGKIVLCCKNYDKNLEFQIKVFDHSLYFCLKNDDWTKIDENFFHLVQNKWFNFLETKLDDYHSNMLPISP